MGSSLKAYGMDQQFTYTVTLNSSSLKRTRRGYICYNFYLEMKLHLNQFYAYFCIRYLFDSSPLGANRNHLQDMTIDYWHFLFVQCCSFMELYSCELETFIERLG